MPLYWRELVKARCLLGYVPNIKKPKTFNEKIIHRKLMEYNACYCDLADKWSVRTYIETKIGKGYLSDVYQIIDKVDQLVLSALPDRFVAKPTHQSGAVWLCDSKENLDYNKLSCTVNRWLNSSYGRDAGEYWYAEMTPRVIIEEYLGNGIPRDYKFFTFCGRVRAIQVDIDRFSRHTRNYYTTDWELMPFTCIYPNNSIKSEKLRPARLEEMIEIAGILGEGHDFVRVDLYYLDEVDRIVFGELTFSPEAGNGRFTPGSYDLEIGKYWKSK